MLIPIIFLAVIFILDLTFGMFYGFGFRHYWFFELLHFLGGFFVAMFLSSFIISKLFVLLGVAAISGAWESMEYVIAKILRLSEYLKLTFRQKSVMPEWKDTALDIVLNFAGALVFLYFLSHFI